MRTFNNPANIIAKRTLVALSLLTLGACSLFQTEQPPPALSAMADNHQLQQWQWQGKIGLRSEHQATSAYINWRQCEQHFDIRLSGPMGQGAAHLYGDDTAVILDRGQEGRLHAPSAEQLLEQQLGWSIPVSQLQYWLRGLPAPELGYRPLATNNGFEQAGWQLSYLRVNNVAGHTLPGKLVAEHPPYKITLILKNWDLQPSCERGL